MQAIDTAGFDLAIIDVNMPEISGYELAKASNHSEHPNAAFQRPSCYPRQTQETRMSLFAKPYRVTDLICASAKAITQAGGNIQSIKAALAKLEAAANV